MTTPTSSAGPAEEKQPTNPQPKQVHCHYCPEHVTFPKDQMKRFMLDKCTQQFVCPGHLYLVNPRKIVQPVNRTASQVSLF